MCGVIVYRGVPFVWCYGVPWCTFCVVSLCCGVHFPWCCGVGCSFCVVCLLRGVVVYIDGVGVVCRCVFKDVYGVPCNDV